MSADFVIAGFLRVAQQDLEGARLLAAANNRNAIYLCEQAAEKVIRAVLTSEHIHAGVGHKLGDFVALIPNENPMKPALRGVEDLASFATAYRYPSPTGKIKQAPAPAEVAAYLATVTSLLVDIAAKFGVDLAGTGPAARSAPIR